MEIYIPRTHQPSISENKEVESYSESFFVSMATAAPFSETYLRADKGPKVLAIIIVFPSLAFITVSLRLYTRFKLVHNPSWEDLAILLALVREQSYNR
jgi:hypothetical protein